MLDAMFGEEDEGFVPLRADAPDAVPPPPPPPSVVLLVANPESIRMERQWNGTIRFNGCGSHVTIGDSASITKP